MLRGTKGTIGVLMGANGPTGVTWTREIASAPCGGRGGPTTVIDAAGTIYVLGGRSGDSFYTHLLRRRVGQLRRRCGPDSHRVLGSLGTSGIPRVLGGYSRVLEGTRGVLKRHSRGTQEAVQWYARRTHDSVKGPEGVLRGSHRLVGRTLGHSGVLRDGAYVCVRVCMSVRA